MEYFKITREQIKKAKTYMPIEEKIVYSTSIANQCLKDYKTAEQNLPGEQFLALPNLKGEDLALKTILLQNLLLGFYFDIELKELDSPEKIYEQYDYYAGGSLLNQIERFKSDCELKDKVFDLIYDYKEFKKMVDIEIYNLKALNNDGIARLTSAIQIISTPENVQKLTEELKRVTDEYQQAISQKGKKTPDIAEEKEEEKGE